MYYKEYELMEYEQKMSIKIPEQLRIYLLNNKNNLLCKFDTNENEIEDLSYKEKELDSVINIAKIDYESSHLYSPTYYINLKDGTIWYETDEYISKEYETFNDFIIKNNVMNGIIVR